MSWPPRAPRFPALLFPRAIAAALCPLALLGCLLLPTIARGATKRFGLAGLATAHSKRVSRLCATPGRITYARFRPKLSQGDVLVRAALRLSAVSSHGRGRLYVRRLAEGSWGKIRPPRSGPVLARLAIPRKGAALSLDMTRVLYEGHPTAVGITASRGSAVCFATRKRAARLDVDYASPSGPGGPGTFAPGNAPGQAGSLWGPQASAATPSAPPGNWRLNWDDEFSGSSLDGSKWNPAYWKGNGFYAPSNVSVSGGLLHLKASSASNSAMVQTLGKLTMRSGRIEIGAKTPQGQGLWPALWLRPTDLSQNYPEIDALEMWMTDDPGDPFDSKLAVFTYHWPDGTKLNGDGMSQGGYRGPDFAAGFHQFAVEWSPGSARWYVDGALRWWVTGPTVDATPLFLVLSLQVGGAFWTGAGEPGPNTRFPAELQVDYVRAYQPA